ncbi:MAG: hypothetical protein WCB46_10830, partial [Methanoregula sp.]
YIPGFPYLLPVPVKFPYKLFPGESLTVGMDFPRIIANLKSSNYPNTIPLRGFFQDQLKNQYERMSNPLNSYLK